MSFDQINPPARLLMGPGPINADPRVTRAMASPLVGQYDPWMTAAMNETMELYRTVFKTENWATMLVDGTSRSAIEAAIVSLVEPGETVLVPVMGRFGLLLKEISERVGAHVVTIHDDERGEITGTRFAVWAPNAHEVRINADFNWWTGDAMQLVPGTGVWCTFV